jgi:hypothetical protein
MIGKYRKEKDDFVIELIKRHLGTKLEELEKKRCEKERKKRGKRGNKLLNNIINIIYLDNFSCRSSQIWPASCSGWSTNPDS